MVSVNEKLKGFVRHRWVVFVCAMWDMSFAGTAYMFGSISPVIKSNMGYTQQQVAFLSVAKDIGDNVGVLAGKISEVSPTWVVTLVGVIQSVVGYGFVWLIVTHRLPSLPLWMLCIFIFVGQNGATYYNTSALVSCLKSFPESRGPVVGILKGFVGLSGAIWTQIIAMINFPDQASLIFIIAVGPAMVSCAFMFIIRPVEGYNYKQSKRASDGSGFFFIYSICLLLAAYLMGVLLLENTMKLDHKTITVFAVILIILVLLPILVPIIMVFFSESKSLDQETFLEPAILAASESNIDGHVEDYDMPPILEGVKKMRNGPCLGEDFTLMQALANADFWILFLSLLMGSGSGLTMINNMGQICQSLGDNNANVYISVISIFNFLGRVAGGYFSEVILRKFAYPRLAALVVVQWMMALGLSYYAMGLAGQVYIVAISMGLGFGAHWSIALSATSELFGLKNFGTIFNFLTISNPIGSLFFSGFVASKIYDYYAEQQAKHRVQIYGSSLNLAMLYEGENDQSLVCEGNICFSLTCGIFTVLCTLGSVLSLILVHRTKKFYAELHRNSLT